MSALPPMQAVRLGRVEYDDGLAMQDAVAAAVLAGNAPDTLLLLEHPPVITLGRGAKGSANVLVPEAELEARGVALHDTGRGGDVTWHGPGQIVGYPIVNLARTRETKDVRKFVRSLEEILIRVCADRGIAATRDPVNTGVWAGRDKVGAIGVRIAKWVSSHGFALNVNPDLSYFDLIVPCGITDRGVTSIAELTGDRGVAMGDVETRIVAHARDVWAREVAEREADQATIAVVIRRKDRFLVLRRVPSRGGFRQIVTGRVEAGESYAHAAARELREETGFEAPVKPLGYEHGFAVASKAPGDAPRFGREICFLADVDGEVRLSDEHDEHAWQPLPEAIAAVRHHGHRRALRLAAASPFR